MTVTAVRAKLTPLAEGVVMAQPSPLTRVVYHQLSGTQKEIALWAARGERLSRIQRC